MLRKSIIALALLLPGIAAAQDIPQRTIQVSATGTVEREPDQGVVQVAVESEATAAQAASQANAEKMTQLVAALRRAGIPDRSIRTTSYQLHPVYSDRQAQNEPPRITGYRALNMVEVTVDSVARLGGIIDVAISNGANRVSNIGFQLRDPHAAHREAVKRAVEMAYAEAQVAAAAAAVQLGRVMSIHTGGYSPMPPPMPMYRGMDMAQAVSTPIESGSLSVQATVTVTYWLVNR